MLGQPTSVRGGGAAVRSTTAGAPAGARPSSAQLDC
jgi:hypothetical protein